MAAHDSSARWRTFLTEAKEDDILLILSKQSPPYLQIPFHELQAFDPEFAEDVLQHPRQILERGSQTLVEICRERGEEIDAMLRVGELPRDSRRNLRDIGTADIERLRSVEVIITKISDLKPRLHIAVFTCEACGNTIEVAQKNERELVEPLRCPTDSGCGGSRNSKDNPTRFNLVVNVSRMVNNQWIEIQELPESVPSGAQPTRGSVLVEGDQVNRHLPGERIVGNVMPVVRSEVRRNRKTPMFDVIYHLISSEHESTPFNEIKINDEDREKILEISRRDDLIGLMQNSIAPSVFATGVMHYVKRSLALQLFGGVSRINQDRTRTRGDIHILLMGDPGVAKSQVLTYMSKISPRGKLASGGGVSGAGLTAAAVRDAFGDGRFALEAGVLPLSDRGLAAIDEFDKISDEDRKVMHPAMEQQEIHVAKGGITATLPSRCAILAAANPKDGRFSKRGPNQSVMRSYSETGLPPPLASRFDIIWMMRDEVRVEDDERIARYILDNRTKGVSETMIEEAISLDPSEEVKDEIYAFTVDNTEHLSLEFLRKYIAYAKRNHHPDLNSDARAKILEYYTDERQNYGREDQIGESEVIPITARALEALIRLTEAHARMHLRDTATGEDAGVALAVFRHWRDESGIEDDSELYSGVSATARSNNTTIRNIIREICHSGDGTANITDIYNSASSRKITETTVDDVLQRMLMSGELFSPRNDFYSFAR
ncbi:MAG: minichromosome maintenance protein MCM [Candidatus Thermoplasmatota archaeon]|nr:minichromosome maintenance protein MCM [Candidatus Thermoplasmatota archaeon]